MNTEILPLNADPAALLIPPNASKDTRSRLGSFAEWLKQRQRSWHEPDLRAYRDAMLRCSCVSRRWSGLPT